MPAGSAGLTTVSKEMGLTHEEFFSGLPRLLAGMPHRQQENLIRFQLGEKEVEIELGPQRVRQLGPSIRLPATGITLRFFDCSAVQIDEFIRRFNLTYHKGGG